MSECIITRRGWTAEGKPELRTEVITGNTNWTVPNYKSGAISVRLFGGGGTSPVAILGGGSGWMNNGEFTNLIPGQNIRITIGAGSNGSTYGGSGGSSSVGTYLSANGGGASDGGAGGVGGDGFQFGGGGAVALNSASTSINTWARGGNGGMYGGGGGGCLAGGYGGMYGGGGGGGVFNTGVSDGNNGGQYGGGGGVGAFIYWNLSGLTNNVRGGDGGKGGEYGGNASSLAARSIGDIETQSDSEDGTNTIGNTSVPENLRGYGKRSSATIIRRINVNSRVHLINANINLGAGGGFGGNAGGYPNIPSGYNSIISTTNAYPTGAFSTSGAGGGGYGGHGGNACTGLQSITYACGGGGGGYGGNGEDGTYNHGRSSSTFNTWNSQGGGGGGYFSDGKGGGGGGYYGYCHGGGQFNSLVENYSYGTGGDNRRVGGWSGACIISYYI